MNNQHSSLRIQGLVRLMNKVRDQLRAGVSADTVDDMRLMVNEAVRSVERICYQHGTTPMQLPAPSRQAYAYLRDLATSGALDAAHLPTGNVVPDNAAGPPSSAIQISGIMSTCNYYHREFSNLVARSLTAERPIEQEMITRLASRLRTETDAIQALCKESGGTPADLPGPSKHGYGWLRYLSDPETLAAHLNTLKHFTVEGKALLAHLPATKPAPTLQVRIYSAAVLYRTQAKGHAYEVTLNEGFAGAPQPVIEALAGAALKIKRTSKPAIDPGHPEDIVKAYASGDAFAQVQAALHGTMAMPTYQAMGQYHDLNLAFERVNAAYFEGKLDRPHLQWNKTRTQRKLGHYDPVRDTVMVSQTLDAARVPDYVIDFVVYHELLHKTLGSTLMNGRRLTHTGSFRKAERRFRQYAEARAFISKDLSYTKVDT